MVHFPTDVLYGLVDIGTVGQVVYGGSKIPAEIPWSAGPFSSAGHGMLPQGGGYHSDSQAMQ
jgi:hypothetical protein